MRGLTSLFDEVVGDMVRILPNRWLHFACSMMLRRVYNTEENRELKGISKATGVKMYLLVCFNVLLDLFMGCSSGGAIVDDRSGGSKMLHFRTLDWGMPALRRIIVQLDFKMSADGPIIARSITYAGFVGVLTGVRKHLSMSLNFRPTHDEKGKFWSDVRYYGHHLMVLLGRRPSIASTLRGFLLPQSVRNGKTPWSKKEHVTSSYLETVEKLSNNSLTTTACYLCLSDGDGTTVIEKDRITANVRSDKDFIVITNNDIDDEANIMPPKEGEDEPENPFESALAVIAHEAKDRRQCAEHNFHNMRAEKAKRLRNEQPRRSAIVDNELRTAMEVEDIIELVQMYPTTNEVTHFACVLDPKEGTVAWCWKWDKPVSAKWIREHQSETW